VRGEFRTQFDLHRFPFDAHALTLRLFNARAASDRIVYALDRRAVARQSPAAPAMAALPGGGGAMAASLASPVGVPWVGSDAFHHLTQWHALRVEARRDVLVTPSALGDPMLVGTEQVRELSGFRFEMELRRRTLSTLTKTLLPVGLMTLMMFVSLWFPPALVRDKVAVAITGALSGAVLLAAINSQLGNVAYMMDVEYAFYVFFALALLCALSVSLAERLRNAGRGRTALLTERATRLVFFLAVSAIAAAGWLAATQ
jgi:branched-chain amino acid transport system substrate-binding protein